MLISLGPVLVPEQNRTEQQFPRETAVGVEQGRFTEYFRQIATFSMLFWCSGEPCSKINEKNEQESHVKFPY
jgi:hypothetical protein